MQIMSLYGKYIISPVLLADRVGDGADGEVYNIKNDPSKVIKFSIIYDYSYNVDNQYTKVDKVLSYICDNNPKSYARIYDHKFLIKDYRKYYDNLEQSYIIHYYIMEKLNKISEDEKRVFHSILSHEDSGKIKNYELKKITEMLMGMGRALDFDTVRIILFFEHFRKLKIRHSDPHVRNIMKDSEGNFKFIDFDRAELLD